MAPIKRSNANKWIQGVEKTMEDVGINDREMVLYASQRLPKAASGWWRAYKAAHGEPATWEEFKNVFLQSYIVIQPNNAKQKPEEKKPAKQKPEEKKHAKHKPEEKKPAKHKPEEKKPAKHKPEEKKPCFGQAERCCREQCLCQSKKNHRHACTWCGKIGHVAQGQEEKCSSCDGSHAVGGCTMYPITCFLCEGSDHVPAKCPLYPAVIAATQLSRANVLAALVETQEGEAKTPVDKKAKASTKMDSGNGLDNPKRIKLSTNDAEARRQ